jgi:Family of unknown function (DUF5906)/Primase C terminal 2 (PriCT-2)
MTVHVPALVEANPHARLLAISVFADQKTTDPIKSAPAGWSYVVKLHSSRDNRPSKSGPMLGGYALNGPRSNANVPFRSLIQLDIDSQGDKDKATGQILRVTRAAPPLDEIRSGIDEYEWCAASSHSHEPQRGVIKYRIVILPDRDILPEEWKPLLEALDESLHGALDRDAWQWSQAFYLPSCPAENQADAFFVHNQGAPLPVDEFVRRGREIIAAQATKRPQADLGSNLPSRGSPPPESPENIERIKKMLSAIPPDIRRNEWRQICWAVLATNWGCAESLIREWSMKGKTFVETDFANVVRDFDPNKGTGFGTLVHFADKYGQKDAAEVITQGVTIDHFCAYMQMHNYIFKPTGEQWPATSVDARLARMPAGVDKTISASKWLDQNRAVEQMTWAPGEPQLIPDRLVSNGGWLPHKGTSCFNLYRPPILQPGGDPRKALRWLEHIFKLYPNDYLHIIGWLTHRVQRPQEKINHALVLGGPQGIGKDTILEPVKRAIGSWNFEEVSPQQVLNRFNSFVKSVILRVSEARDLGDVDRFQFYEHMKTYTASPPDVLRIDEKHLREYYALNCCGVIITTNHKTDGIYLPPDDRRHYVAWSECAKDDFDDDYWRSFWEWYEDEGFAHVAAFLAQRKNSAFDAKAPPLKTPAFWDVIDAHRAPEDAELADAIDSLGNPDALTLDHLKAAPGIGFEFGAWISDRKNRRAIPHRLDGCGYMPVRNGNAADGLWKIKGARVTIYAKKVLPVSERLTAAAALTR